MQLLVRLRFGILSLAFLFVGVPAGTAQDFELPATDDGIAGEGPIRRYDWFRNLWKRRRASFAKEVDQKQGALVFFGDSITQGWGEDFGGRFPGVKKANRGISGDTTRGMLLRLQEDVLSLNPSAVVMLMGTNDLEEGASPEVIAGNVKLILAQLQRHDSQLPIVLCKVFPSSATKKRPADQIKSMNKLYEQAATGMDSVTILDTWTLFADAKGDAKKEEFPDLLHPNAAGYDKWTKSLLPVFATLGIIETKPDAFQCEEGFESLFDGQDLDGWGYRRTSDQMRKSRKRWQSNDPNAPPWPLVDEAVSFDGETESSDGRYVVRNGRLVVTTPPGGRRIQQLWTKREFGSDFTLKLEFRATPNADSGVFIRGPQLQCRDFALAGPYKNLKSYRPQDWNELVVEVRGGNAKCSCNGELLEEAFKVPANGPIGIEGDRGQMEYRRIRIRIEE